MELAPLDGPLGEEGHPTLHDAALGGDCKCSSPSLAAAGAILTPPPGTGVATGDRESHGMPDTGLDHASTCPEAPIPLTDGVYDAVTLAANEPSLASSTERKLNQDTDKPLTGAAFDNNKMQECNSQLSPNKERSDGSASANRMLDSEPSHTGVCSDSAVTMEAEPCRSRNQRKRKRRCESMEHSGLQCSIAPKRAVEDMEVMICLKPVGLTEASSPHYVARQLMRCLHEPKFHLLNRIVEVLGKKKAMDYYHRTADIQLNGGCLTADGTKKKSPGGVFLTMVKDNATAEQRKEIFAPEKKLKAEKKKQKRAKDRTALEDSTHILSPLATEEHRPRQDLNMEKRTGYGGTNETGKCLVAKTSEDQTGEEEGRGGGERGGERGGRGGGGGGERKSVFKRLGEKPLSECDIDDAVELEAMDTESVSSAQAQKRPNIMEMRDVVKEQQLAEEFELLYDVNAPGLELD